jgi:hypothetical protein
VERARSAACPRTPVARAPRRWCSVISFEAIRYSQGRTPPPRHSNVSIDRRARSKVAEVVSSATSLDPHSRYANPCTAFTCIRYSSANASRSCRARSVSARSSARSRPYATVEDAVSVIRPSLDDDANRSGPCHGDRHHVAVYEWLVVRVDGDQNIGVGARLQSGIVEVADG